MCVHYKAMFCICDRPNVHGNEYIVRFEHTPPFSAMHALARLAC